MRQGEVDIVVKDLVVKTVPPGGIFGEMALIDEKTGSATARAKSECKVVPVDERQFTFMVQQTPNFALHVMRVLAQRLRTMNRQM